MGGNNMRKIFLLVLGCLGFSSLVTADVTANGGTTPPFNPGYLGRRQALTVQTVTNFAGLFRTPTRYQNNFAFMYETSLNSTLSYQFGYKGYNRSVGDGDWEDYDIHVVEPGIIWSNDKVYQASGEMDFNYKEFTVGVKNYLGSTGATAPYGGYVLANVNYGLVNCESNNLHWRKLYSSSSWDTLAPVGNSGVSSSIVSISYGFGTRNMITDQLGVVFEATSGLTLLNSAGLNLYVIDTYSSGYDRTTQQEVMTSVMLREIHKSQWIQLKLGLSYLF
jgi:hypothetical protein